MDQEMDQKILIVVSNCHMQSPPSVAWIKPIKIQVACPLLPTHKWEDLKPQYYKVHRRSFSQHNE